MRDIWFCKFCLRQREIEHDGTNGRCLGCGTPVVKLRRSADIFDTAWFPLAEAFVEWESPLAGGTLKALERADESASGQDQVLFNMAAAIIIGIFAGVALKKLLR